MARGKGRGSNDDPMKYYAQLNSRRQPGQPRGRGGRRTSRYDAMSSDDIDNQVASEGQALRPCPDCNFDGVPLSMLGKVYDPTNPAADGEGFVKCKTCNGEGLLK